jgi:hypothetical protein
MGFIAEIRSCSLKSPSGVFPLEKSDPREQWITHLPQEIWELLIHRRGARGRMGGVTS